MSSYGWRGASNGIATGFSMMDDWYARKEGRARAGRRDRENNRRWNITNERQEMSAGLSNDLAQRQIQAFDDEEIANTWESTMRDGEGQPVDFTKLDSNQLKTKKSQIMSVMNKSPALRQQLASNPNVDPENPLANMDFIFDQKTKKPSAVFSLRMKDGTVKPMTELRSDAEEDNVVIMPLSDLDSQVSAMVGSRGAMGARRKATAEMATEARQFGRDKTLAGIRASEKGIKDGTIKEISSGVDMYGFAIKTSKVYNAKTDQWVPIEDYNARNDPALSSPQVGANNAPTDPDEYYGAMRKANPDASDKEIEDFIKGKFPKWKKGAKAAPKKEVKEKTAAKKSSFMAAEAAEKPDTVKKKAEKPKPESVKPKPKSVKPSPYAVQEGDKARGGITGTMATAAKDVTVTARDAAAAASPIQKRTMKQSVQQAIKTKDRKTLRKMSQKKLIEVAETMTKAERKALANLMGVNVGGGNRAVMAE